MRHKSDISSCTLRNWVTYPILYTLLYYCPRWSESLTYPAVHWGTGSLTQYCTLCSTNIPGGAKAWHIQLYTEELGHLPSTVHSAVLLSQVQWKSDISNCTLRNWVTYPILYTLQYRYYCPRWRWKSDISSCTLRNWVTYPILYTLQYYCPRWRWKSDISSCTLRNWVTSPILYTLQYYCSKWSKSLTYPPVHWGTGSLTQYCTLCSTVVLNEAKVWHIRLYRVRTIN